MNRQWMPFTNTVYILTIFLTAGIFLAQVPAEISISRKVRCRDACINPGFNWTCEACVDGCHGRICDQLCRRCDVTGCAKSSGRCHNCKPGYYGEQCQKRCSKGCERNKYGIAECERRTGYCDGRCRRGFYGEGCHLRCPVNCKHSSCGRYLGVCSHGCEKDWSGFFCNKSCENCKNGLCFTNGVCKQDCKDGFFGNKCTRTCLNCQGGQCDQNTGECAQCQKGLFGLQCEDECNQDCAPDKDGYKTCDRLSGRCLNGCIQGTYGHGCNLRCSPHCKFSTCSVYDGLCTHGCRENWQGTRCESPQNCLGNNYNGIFCKSGCRNGLTGRSCDIFCPLNCKSCDEQTGRCTSCYEGYHGEACVQECSFRCKNLKCRLDGSCTEGCLDGFTGYHCDELCDTSCLSCHRFTGTCTTCIADLQLEDGICIDKDVKKSTRSNPLMENASSRPFQSPCTVLEVTGLLLGVALIVL